MANNDKQNRELKLCQLINDRPIDNEIGAEIRKLLIEGVDINIRDLSHNNNTPLHLAAQKSDKNCVKLLLKYKPDLQLRNENDETPFDIARSDDVRELLSSASFDVVRKKFVREVQFQNLSLERLKCLEADPAFKVLKITRCLNAQVVWEKLSQCDHKDAINNSSHLFFIAIETQENEIKKLRAPSADIKRPIIVQVTSSVSNKSSIYYKDEDAKKLIEVKFHSPIGKKNFLKKIHLETFCNFASLVQALNSNIFGTFSGSLLDVKLKNDKDRSEIVNCFANSDALCHRFFKLFDENITEEELSVRATSALKFPGDQSLLALLDLPFDFKDEIWLNNDQKEILSFADSRSYNLLMLAIECNNNDAVKALLRFPIDMEHVGDNQWASDLCWINQHWEILAELIKVDSPYPDDFDASLPSFATSTAFGKIKSSMEAAAALHKNIQDGDIEAVKQFIACNPKLKHVYDRSNKSALTVALESDEAEIISLLLSERFTPGVDVEYEEAFKNCNVKYEIMEENREYFRKAFDEPHLVRLLSKYKLSFSSTDRETYSKVIQNMFLTLNEIPEIVPILKIVSCSEHLNIVFDFDCHSVHEMDPTVGSGSTGLTYQSGFIYVGAKNHREDFLKVIGTLAHELTHYAMKLTYENGSRPYAINDHANQDIFESIVDETRNLVQADPSTDPIISTVFTLYPHERWHQELIVRVPHLMANHKNAAEALDEAKHKNYRLFNFLCSKVLPDVKAQTKDLMHKLEIRKINSLTGAIEKIKKYELQLKDCKVELEDQIFGSNVPQLTLGMLHQSLDESSHVFINIEQIAYGNILERICKLEKEDFAIVVDCTEMVQKHAETICNVREIFKTGKIFLVMENDETSIVTPKLTCFKVTNAHHNWSDLADESQDVLLQKENVNFQGTTCSLNKLTNRNSAALLDLPLKEFCNSENFKIGDPLSDPEFYLQRNFITRKAKKIRKTISLKPTPASVMLPRIQILKKDNKGDQLHREPPGTSDHATNSNGRPQTERRIFKSGPRNLEGVIESEKITTVVKTLDEILVESKSSTVVIISDSAGSGKTSTLHEIARRLEGNDRTRWTLLTDLKQHIEIFKEIQGDFKSFQDFITNIILTDKPIFENKLFAQFHQEGRTNILLDGFDEISPHYKKEILKALKLFTPKSGNQLWITTRSHLELELEKTLGQLSCSLQALTREAQIEFLENFWKTDPNSSAVSSQENFSNIAEGLIDKLSSICDSKSSFTGLPIVISIVAEIFDDSVKRNTIQLENLSFYSIFQQIVDKKIYISKHKGELAEEELREISKISADTPMNVHRKIAVAHIFGNEIADVDFEYDDGEWTVAKLTRFGLIRYDESKRNLSFIHETFAKYFLTDFIVGNLRTKTSAVKILVKVLSSKDFQVVRLFLDQVVKEFNFIGDKKLCEIVGKQLNEMLEQPFGVLQHISEESYEGIFEFMLHAIEHVEEQILQINKREKDGSNVLQYNIASNSKAMIKTLFDFITQHKNLQIAKETVQALNNVRKNIFHVATHNKNEEIFSTLQECMQPILAIDETKKMLSEKDQDGWNVLHCAAAFCSEKALNDLTKILKGLFSNEELKEMLDEVSNSGDNSLHVAARSKNKIALKSFFKHLNVIVNREETKKLIQRRRFEQRNIFLSACENKNEEIFSTLLESMQPILATDEIKRMLREKNQLGWNVLHYPSPYCNENALNDLMRILKGLFSNEELKEMFAEVSNSGENSLHVAARLRDKITLKSFLKHLNIIMNLEEAKEMVQALDDGRRNIFQSACCNKNEEIFSTLYESMQPILATDEIKTMLNQKSSRGMNILQLAASFKLNENALNDLMRILKELFSDEEVKAIFAEVNNLHVAARLSNRIALKSFFKHLNVTLNPEEIKKLIQQKGQQRNVFQSACYNKNEEIFSTLHECMQPILTTDDIRKMLREKDEDGRNILHHAAQFCNENALNDLMKILIELFSNEEVKAILFEVNKDGDNSLHVAARLKNRIALKSFFKRLNVILNPEETKKLIQQRGCLRRNIFQSACLNKNEEIFSTLHECAANFFENNEIKEMLNQKAGCGMNILQLAEKFRMNENAMNDLVKIMKIHFSNEEMKAMTESWFLAFRDTVENILGFNRQYMLGNSFGFRQDD